MNYKNTYATESNTEDDCPKLVEEQGVFPRFGVEPGSGLGLYQPADDIFRTRARVGGAESR